MPVIIQKGNPDDEEARVLALRRKRLRKAHTSAATAASSDANTANGAANGGDNSDSSDEEDYGCGYGRSCRRMRGDEKGNCSKLSARK